MLKSHKALRLVDPDTTSYKLHPVVVFSILDHYKRRGEKQQRVIGALIGNQDGNVISISDSFPVPHNETDETVSHLLISAHICDCCLVCDVVYLLPAMPAITMMFTLIRVHFYHMRYRKGIKRWQRCTMYCVFMTV